MAQMAGANYQRLPVMDPVPNGDVVQNIPPTPTPPDDGGFELCIPANTPNACASWLESSTNFGSPVCDIAFCGNGAGTAAPHGGNNWAWLGGTGNPEDASISQSFTIPAEDLQSASLEFYLWTSVWSGNAGDYFEVTVDGTSVFSLSGADLVQPSYSAGYSLVRLNMSAFADDQPHTLQFHAVVAGGGTTTSMHVDDISMSVKYFYPVPGLSVPAAWLLTGLLGLFAGWRIRHRQSLSG
jgi:hypothetical protein